MIGQMVLLAGLVAVESRIALLAVVGDVDKHTAEGAGDNDFRLLLL